MQEKYGRNQGVKTIAQHLSNEFLVWKIEQFLELNFKEASLEAFEKTMMQLTIFMCLSCSKSKGFKKKKY